MKCTITRALAEIKILDKRIENAIDSGAFLAVTRGTGDKRTVLNTSETIENISGRITASYDSVEALIKRRQLLKAKIVEANATNKITICGEEMTVAAAIERRTSIQFEQKFLVAIRSQYEQANLSISKLRTNLEADIDKALASVYGNDKGKVTVEQHEAVATPKREVQEPGLLDPRNVQAYIEKLTKRIEDFGMEIDFTLSEFNAKTEIEIEETVKTEQAA